MMWVLENTGHIAAHLTVHVPRSRQSNFKEEFPIWIAKETKRPPQLGAVDIKSVYNIHGLRKYLLKGIDPAFAPLYRIEHIPQGAILGKRFGYTQNLGPSETRRNGTRPNRGTSRIPPSQDRM